MKSFKVYTIVGIIFVCVLGTLLHFAYAWSKNNFVVGLFTPINESTWEHMKLLFFPMFIFSIYEIIKLKSQYPCIISAMALSTLIGTLMIAVLFYTYSGVLGYNIAIIDIAIFYISVISAFFISYKATLSCRFVEYSVLIWLSVIVLAIAFIIFTVFPPNIALFMAP